MIVKLCLEDAILVAKDMRPEDRACLTALLGSASPEWFAVSRWQTDGPAWCLYQDEEPVAIFGISFQTKWSGTAWLTCRPHISHSSWRKLVRHCRTVAGNLPNTDLHRVEALVMEEWGEARKFARRLGFKLEGTRVMAGMNGENVQVWGLT